MSIVIGNWQGMLGGVLAPRELEGILHCANDCTVKQASKAMGISPETLKKRLESARFKLKVASIRALVLEAFRRGLIVAVACAAPADPDPQHDQDQRHQGVFLA
jgi:DNA-binding CsgD family transcriptional regulator